MSVQFENPITGDSEYFVDESKIVVYTFDGGKQTYLTGEELVIINPAAKMYEIHSDGLFLIVHSWPADAISIE